MLVDQNIALSRFEAFLESVAPTAEPGEEYFLSYSIPWVEGDFRAALHEISARYDSFASWYGGEDGGRFIAGGSVVEVGAGGERRFQSIRDDLAYWQDRIVSNRSGSQAPGTPLFFAAAMFADESTSEAWEDFPSALWILPEVIISDQEDGPSLSFQCMLDGPQSRESAVWRFEEVLQMLEGSPDGAFNRNGRVPVALSGRNGSATWEQSVVAALEDISRNRYEKIVLSRAVQVDVPVSGFSVDWIEQLAERYPRCQVFAVRRNGATFFGASPERLLAVRGGRVTCNAVAGSIRRGGDEAEDLSLGHELLHSHKNLSEHNFVVRHISDVMARFCDDVRMDPQPALHKLSYIQHLYLDITGRLKPGASIIDLAAAMHPTPAVGGYPARVAVQRISELENYDRGLYAGFVGWCNHEGEADFCVAIRSALLKDGKLHVFAGAGIVEGSDPHAEYEETEIKMAAITSLLTH